MTSAARHSHLADTALASGVPDPQDIHAGVWHAHTLATPTEAVQATGDALLDAHLPGGGWPVGALVELLQPAGAHSEWRLLLPALAACGRGPVVMVGPPQLPFAPALSRLGLRSGRLLSVLASTTAGEGARVKDEASGRLWATEQVLRCAEVDAVLAWLPQARGDQLRRLHLAAAEHHKLLFVMRPDRARSDASPAVLRLLVQPMASARHPLQGLLLDGLEVDILKRRGPPLAEPLHLQARSQQLGLLLAASRALTQGMEQERASVWGMLSDTPLDAQATRAAFQQQALGGAQSQALPWPPLPPAQGELAVAAHGAADAVGYVDVETGHALDRAAAVA
ncbi:translesion DNA synthesis-associated protein ImuA [Rhodoferax sp. TBRC 17660]|uniref:Translesion DNA synthesis-associated protein ImuA n=1 Tax=Rhodoferax potami TaxID=3068338 RepID=A0ABU3KPY5_9BURK|nr:translesion DNA synthesis-associated protein ImuA [Rhodoferax sp. TBRC 17660]MDT7519531.1 translesion DNA synthesis-associated protein ImuA [Rhodoferax sp. TBRC 17660]